MSIFRRASPIGLELSLFGDVVEVSTENQKQSAAEEVGEHFQRLRTPVYAYVLSVCGRAGEAEELTQEVFLRLYSYLQAGNRVQSVRAWAFRVAHNLAINQIKRSRHEIPTEFSGWIEHESEPDDERSDPEQLFEEQERHALLLQDMKTLTDHQRRCLQLRAEGFRYREIAEILDLSIASVSDALDRAVKKLRRSPDV